MTDIIGERRDAEADAFGGIGLALTVERLMQAELVEQDHGQQVGAGASARDRMEGRRRLGDGSAITADELLADGLQHDPLPRHDFEAVGLGLADLLELSAAAARAVLWCGHDNTVTRQMLWQGAADGLAAGEGCDGDATGLRPGHGHLGGDLVFGGGGNEIFELHLELVEETAATFGRLAPLVGTRLGNLQFELFDERAALGDIGQGDCGDRLGVKLGGERVASVQALGHKRCLERLDVVRKSLEKRIHRGSV